MLRAVRWLVLALVALVLVVLALANRQMVLLSLLPAELARYSGLDWQIRLPLFVVILGGVVAGLALGFLWEWVREARHRGAERRARRDKTRLERELARARPAPEREEDEILEIVDGKRKAG